MKKCIICILCLVLLMACSNSQEETPIEVTPPEIMPVALGEDEPRWPSPHPFDVEYEEEWLAANNALEMQIVFYTYGNKWQEEMERYLQLMQYKLDEEKWELVSISQEKWRNFVWSDVEVLEVAYYNEFRGASLGRMSRARDHYNRHRERTLHLHMLYIFLMADPDRED